MLKEFFVDMRERFGERWATFKNHIMIHIPDDCSYHECSMDALSAYQYENLQRFFVEVSCLDIALIHTFKVSKLSFSKVSK